MDKNRRNLLKGVIAISIVMLVMYGAYYGFQQFQLSKKHVEGVPSADSVYKVRFSLRSEMLETNNAEDISKLIDALSTAKATNIGVYSDADALRVSIRFYKENGEEDVFFYHLITDGSRHYLDIDYYPYYSANNDDTLWIVDDEFYELVLSVARRTMEEYEGQESTAIDTAPAADSASDTEKTLFDIWEFEGYVDECDKYTWKDEFKNCDYDDDGKIDRLSRSWNEDKELATYTIEFGNGDKLVTPEGYETGFPHVQTGDIDGDGAKEILVTLTYDTSTDPYAFGEMWLFDRDQTTGEYEEVELPLVEIEKGAKGFNVDYDKPVDNKIKFTLREAGLSKTEEVDADYLSYWWSDDLTTQQISVFNAEILEQEGSGTVLRCYVQPLHRWGLMMGFNLNYVNGKYEIGYIEIDSPHSWE